MPPAALRRGVVRYPRRRVGLVYDRREFSVRFGNDGRVDFWACEAGALPLRERSFVFVAALNVLDCVGAPAGLLASIGRLLAPEGKAIVTTPFDWSPAATPVESWLGGHSQRGPERGASEAVLRDLLTPGAHPASVPGIERIAEVGRLGWQVRMHDRAIMDYSTHLTVFRSA